MMMDINQLADKLGMSVSGVYTWVSQRKIPFVKIGHLIRFDSNDIDKWLEEKKVKARFN